VRSIAPGKRGGEYPVAVYPQACVRNAERFGVRGFADAMREVVAGARPGPAGHPEGRGHTRARTAPQRRGARG
jgi:hypothetical protein